MPFNLSIHPSITDCIRSQEYTHAIDAWRNYSLVWQNSTYFYLDFVCKKIKYDLIKEKCESLEGYLVLPLGVLGFFGALMSVLTFFRRPFVASDVYLYRTVGVFECIHMLVMSCLHISALFQCHRSYLCTFLNAHIYLTVANLCAEAVEFIVVFLGVERTVACMAPQHFHKIHNICAYRTAAVLAVFSSLPLNIIHSFDRSIELRSDQFEDVEAWFAGTSFYDGMLIAQMIRFCLICPVIVAATVLSIVGLWKAAGRKSRLRGESLTDTLRQPKQIRRQSSLNGPQHSSASAERAKKDIKQMIDLCCLQLCLAIPIVINYLLCMAERAAKWNIQLPDRARFYDEAFGTMTYDEACVKLSRASSLEYLRLTISLTHMMAHGLHFYLYISFSAKFRQTLCEWWCGTGKNVKFGRIGKGLPLLRNAKIPSKQGGAYNTMPVPAGCNQSPNANNHQNEEEKEVLI